MCQVFGAGGEPLLAELLARGVDGPGDAVAEDDQAVAIVQLDRFLFGTKVRQEWCMRRLQA
jgi:hypothetical protein